MSCHPEVGDFVELKFEGEFSSQSPIKGRVLEVDMNPEIPETEMVFVVNDESGGRKVMYGEGDSEGENWSNVSVVDRNIVLGRNAKWRLLD